MINSLKHTVWVQLFIIYTRYLIGGAFVFACVIKIKGLRFTAESGADAPIHSPFHLFETLYQTGLYWNFIGYMQLLAGFLLMTQRYAKLGALINFPIICNVFMITLSLDFNDTVYITGLMLAANILLLFWHANEFKILINLNPVAEPVSVLESLKTWEWTGLLIFLFTFLYRLRYDRYDIILWFFVSCLIGLAGLIIGLWQYNKAKAAKQQTQLTYSKF